MSNTQDARQSLEENGYFFLPSFLDDQQLETLRGALVGIWEANGKPELAVTDDVEVGDGLVVSAPGLVVMGIMARKPELSALVTDSRLLETIEGVFGEPGVLEIAVGILAAGDREFFGWEYYFGGVDFEKYKDAESVEAPDRLNRIVCMFFGESVEGDEGELRVQPRKVGEAVTVPTKYHGPLPEAPVPEADIPDEEREEEEEGGEATETAAAEPEGADSAVALAGPAGSVVLMDEATWYAEAARSGAKPRPVLAIAYRRASAPSPEGSDPSLAEAAKSAPELAKILGAASS